ncbi:MAG: hypothetical protein ISS78_07100 [Phycisphaerae bacterium]|nr:hypothetical protein [Phycisphaerae bacterium]
MTRQDIRFAVRLGLLSLGMAAFGALVAAGVMVARGAGRSAPKPVTRPARRAVASPAPVETRPAKYPPESLVRACNAEAEALRKRLDGTFTIRVDPPFVSAGNMKADQLARYVRGSVLRPARAMWSSYFNAKPDKVITILLLADGKSYKTWAKKLFNDTDVPFFGYYTSASRTLVMNIDTGTGTLVHELTHALIVYDFPNLPTWFNEGLGSLHEQCIVGETRITGCENWRLPALQKAIADDTLRPLSDLVARRDFYGALCGLNYAQARYFVMYMQQQGVLKKFYTHFRKAHKAGRPVDDVKAIEHVFGRKLPQIEKAFVAWVKTLRYRRR